MRKAKPEIDPVEEVRKVRDALAKQCGYDATKLADLIRADEAKSGASMVSRPARRVGRGSRKAS